MEMRRQISRQQDGDTAAARPLPERASFASPDFLRLQSCLSTSPGWAPAVPLSQLLASPAGSACGGNRGGEVSGDAEGMERQRSRRSFPGRASASAPGEEGTERPPQENGGRRRRRRRLGVPARQRVVQQLRQRCSTGKRHPKHGEMGSAPKFSLGIPTARIKCHF